MNSGAKTGPHDPDGKEVSAEVDSKGSKASGTPPTSSIQSGDSTEDGSVEVPRRRRGILLGTHPPETRPAAEDDGKSLSWMADQAVKALNAVKASQLEQAQALMARDEITDEEDASDREEEAGSRATAPPSSPEEQLAAMRALNAEEASADGASLAVQSGMAAVAPLPASTPPVQTASVGEPGEAPPVPPVEPTPNAAASVPAAVGPTAASLTPVRLVLVLGVVLMFGYAGYRYWISDRRMTGESSAPPSAVIESSAPELGREMAEPAISVVPAPESAGRGSEPAAAAAPAPVAPVAASSSAAPEPGEPEPAVTGTGTSAVHPASEPVPQAWRPAGAPAAESPEPARQPTSPPAPVAPVAASSTAAPEPGEPEPAVTGTGASAVHPASEPVPQAWRPAGAPAAESPEPARQPTSPPASTGRAEPPGRPAAPSVPAAQSVYPARGYGYSPPPASWQPHYRPGYPQPPARR